MQMCPAEEAMWPLSSILQLNLVPISVILNLCSLSKLLSDEKNKNSTMKIEP